MSLAGHPTLRGTDFDLIVATRAGELHWPRCRCDRDQRLVTRARASRSRGDTVTGRVTNPLAEPTGISNAHGPEPSRRAATR